MKLINDLFRITESTMSGSGLRATIRLNKEHIVYAGHFPGHPVTPGVIQMQIVHELTEQLLGREIRLVMIPDCKFLKILDPAETSHATISIDAEEVADSIVVKASGKSGEDIFFKLNAVYRFC